MCALPAMRVSAGCIDFINEARFNALLAPSRPDPGRVREIIDKSLAKEALSLEETAVLLGAEDPGQIEAIFQAARTLKERVYGNRIVLFANSHGEPLRPGRLSIEPYYMVKNDTLQVNF